MNQLFLFRKEMTPIRKLLLMKMVAGGVPLSEYTVAGNPLSFDTNIAMPLKSLLVPFAPTQSGTGDPSPTNVRPISGVSAVKVWHTGKNLLDTNKRYMGSGHTLTIGSEAEDYSVYLKPGTYRLTVLYAEGKGSAAYFRREGGSGTQLWSAGSSTATLTINSACYCRFYLYSSSLVSDDIVSFMLTSGSDEAEYTPYTGQTYPVTFPALGKNLFDVNAPEKNPSDTTQGNTKKRIFDPYTYCIGIAASNYFSASTITDLSISNGTISITTNSAYGVGFALPLTPGKTYRVDATGTNMRINAGCYAADGTFIQEYNSLNTNGFTVPENTAITVIVFVCKTANEEATYSNIMLYEGTSSTPYEPYTNTVYGGSLDVTTGVLKAEYALKTSDGSVSDEWSCGEVGSNLRCIMPFGRLQYEPKPNSTNLYVNYFKKGTSNAWESYVAGTGNIIFFVPLLTIADKTAWLSYLSEHTLQIVYELATPITYQLTPQQITALIGDNTIWSDTNGSNTAVYYKKG